MQIKINGTDLYINDDLYKTAEKAGEFILNFLRTKTKDKKQIQLYYAILLYLHMNTGELLHLIDTDELDILMKAWDVEQRPK